MRSTNPLLLFIYCMALNRWYRQYSQHCYFRTSGNVDELLLQCSICTSTPEFILHHFCLPNTLNWSTSLPKRNAWGWKQTLDCSHFLGRGTFSRMGFGASHIQIMVFGVWATLCPIMNNWQFCLTRVASVSSSLLGIVLDIRTDYG